MADIEKIEREVASLTPRDLAAFREWFSSYDAAAWDRQLESDVARGALDTLADTALAQHQGGHSRPL